jgi:hypothetical protein
MVVETFKLQLPDHTTVKISISEIIKENMVVYKANYVSEDIEIYQQLNDSNKESEIGVVMKDDEGRDVVFRNKELFIREIRKSFGTERLKSQITQV